MADEDEVISANNNDEVFEYMGGDMVVPDDVVRAQVHPSVTVIPEIAFQCRKKLEEIELGEGLIEIGKQSFCICKSLTHINIPSTVKTIGSHAFCMAPLQTLHLPDSIESIGNHAFAPAQKIDWNKVLNTLANVPKPYDGDNESLESILQFLVKVSTVTRVNAIGVKLWRDDMAEMMAEPIPSKQSKGDWLSDAKSKLSHYEDKYQQLKEAATMLELALWKVKLDEPSLNSNEGEIQCNNKRKAEDSDRRSLCRINCGAHIVIENMLPYLTELPADMSDSQSGDFNRSTNN